MIVTGRFYVYEHWRPDKEVCFWVGKGNGDRAFRLKHRGKNKHYNSIVKKLARLGMCVEVRMVASGLEEHEAHALERVRIAFWRERGGTLANITDGGDGVVGLRHSDKTRALIREKRSKQKIIHSPETRAKMSAAHKGRTLGTKNPAHGAKLRGRKHSPEHRAKIGASNMGRIFSAETKAKIGNANRGKVRSARTKEKLRLSHLGKKPSAETIEKRRQSMLLRWANPSQKQKAMLAAQRRDWHGRLCH